MEESEPRPELSRAIWGILVGAFAFTYWQPGQFYSMNVWGSEWYRRIVQNTPILNVFPSWAFAAAWFLVFATTSTAWFFFWKNSEHLGKDYDTIMALIITTIVMTKLWTPIVSMVPWPGIFFVASALTSGPAVAAWVLMFINMGSTTSDWLVYFMWGPIVAWTAFATVFLGIPIWVKNAGVDFGDTDWGALSMYKSEKNE